MNVSSIVVRTAPVHTERVIAEIDAIDFCEVHFYDAQGKIIVTIEGKSIYDQMENMKRIQNIPFVLNANLVYSYCEDELRDALGKINRSGS
ncbi:MAG: chaperone NapD [Nitrospirae bacterium]|nr:chaperone NapD [Nitrospirota bacterium]